MCDIALLSKDILNTEDKDSIVNISFKKILMYPVGYLTNQRSAVVVYLFLQLLHTFLCFAVKTRSRVNLLLILRN